MDTPCQLRGAAVLDADMASHSQEGLENLMQSMPVTLESRALYFSAYKNSPPGVSDIVFNTLFGWQEHFGFKYNLYGDFLLTYYYCQNKIVFLPPLMLKGRISDTGWRDRFVELYLSIEELSKKNNFSFVFSGLPDQYINNLPKGRFNIAVERNSCDYVYRKDDLAELAGQKYSAKRNLIKQFKRNYQYRYEKLSKDNLYCVYKFIRRWKPKGVSQQADISSGEYRMVFRLVKNFDKLGLCGGLLFVGKKEVAATIGTIVPDFEYQEGKYPTVIVHTEHASLDYKGSYQMINQLFCESLPKEVVYINREEDLGIPGLRKSKMSYYPEKLITKSTITDIIRV